jgi:ketosteroid isomerase-like protein
MSEIADAYAAWAGGDAEPFLSLFADDARFFIPGATPVSGDHLGVAAFRPIAEEVARSMADGTHTQEIIEVNEVADGAFIVVHNVVRRGTEEIHYHSMHAFQGSVPGCPYWWLYLHEYPEFERAWGGA